VAQRTSSVKNNRECKQYDYYLMPFDLRGGGFMFSGAKYRRDIQVLRGLAVLAVVLFHAEESYFPLGYLGVDVFFVISGFVVTPLILRIFSDQANRGGRLSNLRYFYIRRFYRLAPALAGVITISAVTIFLLGPIADHQRFARQGIATLLLAGNVGAERYSGDYFSPNPNPLVHTWSLSVEEQIYIFLPLILILVLRNQKSLKKITALVFGVISAVSFVSFLFPAILQPLYSRAGFAIASQISFYSPIDRIWQFTAGGLACLSLDQYHNRIRKIPKDIQLLTVIAVVMILFAPLHMNLKVSSIFASFFAVFVILFKSLDVLPDFLIKKFEWVGDRSYSIYLVHMPFLYLAKYSPLMQIGTSENHLIQSVVAVVASILLGALSYSKIENKYRKSGKADHSSLKTIVVSFGLTLLIPIVTFVSLDRSTAFELKNSGLPVPSEILPWNWDKECQFYSTQPNINLEPCKYGNHNSGKSILLIGDSHAASDSRAIISLGNSNNMNTFVFTFEGCGFVLNSNDFKSSYSYPYLTPDCIKHNQSILNFVQDSKPTVIIYAHRSSSIMVSPNNSKSRNQYNELVLRNLKVLMKENIEIIHIGSEPELLPIVTRVQDWKNAKSKFSSIPFEDDSFWEKNSVTDYYLSTIRVFCPKKICRNNSTKGWLFHDANHLSEIGANRLIPELDPLIKAILSKKR
jgi:peptidoglycan/LPS O-acetylase OafA/YrhL